MAYIGNAPVLQSTEFREEFFPTSNQTAFVTGGFHPSAVSVTRNGVLLSESDYTKGTDNVTITLNSAAISGDVVVIRGNRSLAQGVSVSESRVEHTWQSGNTYVQLNADVIPAYTDVYVNGIKLWYGDGSGDGTNSDYSINAALKRVSFFANPAVGDVIAVVHKNETSALVALPLKDSSGAAILSESGSTVTLANVDTATIGSNALVVDASGNVGIGTSPSAKLHIQGTLNSGGILVEDSSVNSTAPAIKVIGKRADGNFSPAFSGKLLLSRNQTNSKIGGSGIQIGTIMFGGNHTDSSSSNILYAASISGASEGVFNSSTDMPTGLRFYTGSTGRDGDISNVSTGTERMRIWADGHWALNRFESTQGASTGVNGVYYNNSSGYLVLGNDGEASCIFNRWTSTGHIVQFRYNGSVVGSIGATTTNLPSDRDFKKDINDLSLGLELVKKLKPKTYRYKIIDDNSPLMTGLIAQDLEESLAECGVAQNESWILQYNEDVEEGNSKYELDYSKLIPVLTKAIQEQQALIESQQSQILSLTERIEALEATP